MPLKSRAQAAYLKDHDPKVYTEFVKLTPKGTKLPARVRPKGKR